ncbi:transcriptional regulator [Vibrio sp. HA2012]|uniref:phage regulatory CII family protein n=1 Tax=Vibrio sp. HA2012 TaxID=1971595 RepID=UPI000C2C21DE|nr:phage regulatory CII family protein [Vibrio sp. HA2012]PJC85327.1 transcriptional regulator [Vibrio sp. HA2012]
MESKQAMCEFLQSAQCNFDDACVSFAKKHDMTKLAKQVGIAGNSMRNMLNPEQARLLAPPMMIAISKATNDYSIVYALLRELDIVAAHLPSDTSEATRETFLKRVLEHSLNSGELSRMALEFGGDSRLPRTTKNNIIAKCQHGISNLVLIISDLENRTSGMTPFLSMGVDFVANGAPLPGLA